MGKHHTSCMVASVLKWPFWLLGEGSIIFYSLKTKFCPKCFDPHPKSCAFAIRSYFTKYALIILSSRRAIRDNRYRFKKTRRIQVHSRTVRRTRRPAYLGTSALIKAGYRKCIYVFFRFEASYTWYVGWHRLELTCTVCRQDKRLSIYAIYAPYQPFYARAYCCFV